MTTAEAAATPGKYRGRRRPPSRRRLFLKVAVVLGTVTVVLVGVGVAIATTVSSDDEKGRYGDGVADFCPLVDAAPLTGFGLGERERHPQNVAEPRPPATGCLVLLSGEEQAATYLTAELRASMRVYPSVTDALAGYTGTLDFERSEGREPELLHGLGEQAGFVASSASSASEGVEFRLRVRDSNATFDVTVFAQGLAPDAVSNDQVKDALLKIGTKVLEGARQGT
ncbi:hypothetical protein [Actinorhabdospora filicis]|uniref:hypothetical protein n=1 Tax=Actinorhabdospora filicis TaxID=1785913 RepID=UPI0025574FDE|nr:hypothetical protein [Actinorhabdospora filicis]